MAGPSKKAVALPVEEPAKWDKPDAAALQALAAGTANAGQQQRALNWIIYEACGTYELDYRPDPRDHAFVSGKRRVGLQIISLLKLKLGVLPDKN
jgi:hypothetical protein